jgi:pseudouridine-5'-phosphate glycosidase
VLAPDVADALRRGLPVVALESTIISHGMPYPDNLTMAREVEAIVREHGATPATIAIIDGVPRVGLTDDQLVQLASLARPRSRCPGATSPTASRRARRAPPR